MHNIWYPDMVFGVDFGMTATAVAYSIGPTDWSTPKSIQHWPGKIGSELANKVPTKLTYLPGSSEVQSWGFLCEEEEGEHSDAVVRQFFKLYLDPSYDDGFADAPTSGQAQKWFLDYLRCIHDSIERHLEKTTPRWEQKKKDFVFSVPTTWVDPSMVNIILQLINQAGFGNDEYQRTTITLTEAEAAAVYASKQGYRPDEVLMVCDAGGGTTDVNILKMTRADVGVSQLKPLTWVEGRPAGSSLIDLKVHDIITGRLSPVRERLSSDPETIADRMLKGGRFERFKCSFGSDAADMPRLLLPIPDLPPGTTIPFARIENSKVVIMKEELKDLFDEQIQKILYVVDEQFARLASKYNRENVSYLVLSGGFGSSPYVQKRIKERYESGSRTYINGHNVKILLADEPQLSVAYGLVMDKIQSYGKDISVYLERCCRQSFGVVCREPYDPILHRGEPVSIDPLDKKKWAENQIDWFIRQGESVSIHGVKQPYKMKIPLGGDKKTWRSRIVMSNAPLHMLPRSLSSKEAKVICTLEYAPKEANMKRKNHRWYNLRPEYHLLEFELHVIIGSATLELQLWSKGDQAICLSEKHDEITVQWNPPKEKGDTDIKITIDDVEGRFFRAV